MWVNLRKKYPAAWGIELILWLMFLLPGLIYSAWRIDSKKQVCAKCDSDQIIPVDTPRGQQMIAERGA